MTGLIRIAPHRGDHRVAIRAAVSIAVPLVILWAIGRVDLSVYASFGAFASLYGRYDRYADRIRMQIAAGLTMVVCMLMGTALSLLATPTGLRVLVVGLIAGVGALIAHAWRWHPPSSLFAVFSAGACASLPATTASLLEVVIVGGASALFSMVLTAGIALARQGRRLLAPVRTRQVADRDAVGAAVTVGIGALLAGFAGLLLIGDHWYWAMVGAVAALGGAHLTARLVRGVQRLVGTLIGVAVAAGLLALHLPPPATIGVAILCQMGAELYVNRNYGLAMLFITPLALLMVELAVPTDPTTLLVDRTLDTLIGVVVGTAVAVASAWVRRARRRSSA